MRNFQILIVSAVKICKQYLQIVDKQKAMLHFLAKEEQPGRSSQHSVISDVSDVMLMMSRRPKLFEF